MIFSFLFYIENGYHIYLIDGINELIEAFSLSDSSFLYFTFDYFIKLLLPLIMLLNAFNYLIGIISNNPQYKIQSMSITRIGSSFLAVLFYVRLLTIVPTFYYGNFDFSELNIFDAVLVVTYIANSIATKTFKRSKARKQKSKRRFNKRKFKTCFKCYSAFY